MPRRSTAGDHMPVGTRHLSPEANAGRAVALLIDAVNESYSDWRRDADSVRQTYKGWCSAPLPLRVASYLAYLAALDHEQAAASRYALAVADLERLAEG